MNSYIEELLPKVNEVIKYSQGYSEVNSLHLLEKWYKAKEKFIKDMGGLIYETPEIISFDLSNDEKKQKVFEVADTVDRVYRNPALANFIEDCYEGFFENKVPMNYHHKEILIPKDMKLVKAFKYFEDNKTVLETIQNYASSVIQENKISGRLCISVHPLDFLSSSENTYNWRSCHSLDGDYRAGNLSYMCDSSTVICYLKGEDDVILPHFPEQIKWNSKKWRMLLFISDNRNLMFAGRQYPFFSETALNQIQEEVCNASLIPQYLTWSNWHNDQISSYVYKNHEYVASLDDTYLPIYYKLRPIREIIIDKGDPMLHFNDLLCSSSYKPYYCWNSRYSGLIHQEKIEVGCESVPCVCCGVDDICASETMCCERCYDDMNDDIYYSYCDNCGTGICNSDDLTHVEGIDEYFCDSCIESYCTMCSECGEYYLNEHIIYDRDTELYVCKNCKGENE